MNNYQQMNTSIQCVIKNTTIVALSSVSGTIMWDVCKHLYNYQIHNKLIIKKIKNMIHFNFGTFFGFSLGVSYIYTGKPFIYTLKQTNR